MDFWENAYLPCRLKKKSCLPGFGGSFGALLVAGGCSLADSDEEEVVTLFRASLPRGACLAPPPALGLRFSMEELFLLRSELLPLPPPPPPSAAGVAALAAESPPMDFDLASTSWMRLEILEDARPPPASDEGLSAKRITR